MALAYASWVSETGTLTGTDPTYTLPNTASPASGNQFLRTIGAAFTAATDIVLAISSSSGAETSLWSFAPGTGGAAGTITRVQLLDSSTGAVINWSGATVTIECSLAPPVLISGGTANSGLIAGLGPNGVFDGSLTGSIKPTQPGQFYFNPYASVFSYAPNASTLYFVWMPIAQQTTIKTISLSSYGSPSAAISLEMGIYSADPTTGAPSALLVDGGAATISSNTTPQVTLPSGGYTVNAPGVWVAIGTPATLSGWSWVAFRALSTFNFPSAQGNSVGNLNNPIVYIGYLQSWTPGALPTNISPSYANEGSNFPLVCIGT